MIPCCRASYLTDGAKMCDDAGMTSTKGYERVENAFAGQGAVRQNGGTLPVYCFTDCGCEFVWCKSARTGKSYPAKVRRGYRDQRFYQGNDLHPRDCAEQQAEKLQKALSEEQRMARFSQVMQGWQTEIKRLKDSGAPKSEILAAIDEMGEELKPLTKEKVS